MNRAARSAARRRFARRVSLGLMVLAAVVAACAIMFHRMHGVALDESRQILLLETQRRAVLAVSWLEARRDAFARFATALPSEEALDPDRTNELMDRLRGRDQAFTDLALMDPAGRALSGSTRGTGVHGAFPWLRDASRGADLSGGIYPGPDGGPRVYFSRRLTPEGRGTHLRAEAGPEGLANAVREDDLLAAWFLLDGRGAALPLGGPPAPGAALAALDLYARAGGEAAAQVLEKERVLAVSPLPGMAGGAPMGPALAVSAPLTDTPYRNLGLALTVLAAACLAYAGYVRARALKP